MDARAQSIHSKPTRKAAAALLESAGLPASDLTDAHMDHFFYNGSSTAPCGLIGIERYGPDGLLRSLVVEPGSRAAGLGSQLVCHAERFARSQGVRTLCLLTTTAEAFFSRRGYVAATRETAPAAIRATREFAGLCPASSAFLFKKL